MRNNYAEKLPDSFAKKADSNNAKILELDRVETLQFHNDIEDILNCTDLSLATGATLDLFGDMVGQKRGELNDTQYRYMILTCVARNLVRGDYQSIMDSVVRMFNCNQKDVAFEDVSIEDDETPCVVKLIKMPVFVLVEAGFTTTQAVQMIQSILPVCTTLIADNFEGTFEFSNQEDEYDKNAGFADPLQTYGGYLGLLLGEDKDSAPLPL